MDVAKVLSFLKVKEGSGIERGIRERDETRADGLKGMPFFAIRIELKWYLDPLLFATWLHLVASERARLLGKPVCSHRLFTLTSTTDATIYILRTLIYVRA